jgi:hypothetical protein
MASDRLAATLDELITVLKNETNLPAKAAKSPAINANSPEFAAGWSAGWDACRDEVMKIIGEGLGARRYQ